jgi:hypothetical protein
LIDQAVREWIAERHAQFEDIHASLIERERELARRGEIGITRADVNDESFLPRAPQFRQPCLNAIHAGKFSGRNSTEARDKVCGAPELKTWALKKSSSLDDPQFLEGLL